MKSLTTLLMVVGFLIGGCASTRTRFTDPGFRVFLDPESIDPENYIRIEHGLHLAGFQVVDRSAGYRAAMKEQEETHLRNPQRYAPKERWAHWAEMYGAKNIVVASTSCQTKRSFWNSDRAVRVCFQMLQLVDGSTGALLLSVQGESSVPLSVDFADGHQAPSWDDTAQTLADVYPRDFEKRWYGERVEDYRQISGEEATRVHENYLDHH